MKFTLNKKVIIMTIVILFAFSFTSLLISAHIVDNMVEDHYMAKANELSATIAKTIDIEAANKVAKDVMDMYHSIPKDERVGSEHWGTKEFKEYVAKFSSISKTSEFKKTLEQLRAIQSVNDVDCVYIICLDIESRSAVYAIDAALEDACPPGNFDPIYGMNKDILKNPERGFPAFFTDTGAYGELVTSASPVYNEAGEIICYASVDISMEMIRNRQKNFVRTLIGVMLLLTIVICVIIVLMMNRFVIRPIKKLTDAAVTYCCDESLGMHETFAKVDIKSNDEIRILADSMKQMEIDINDYIANYIVTNDMLNAALAQQENTEE